MNCLARYGEIQQAPTSVPLLFQRRLCERSRSSFFRNLIFSRSGRELGGNMTTEC